MPRKTQQEGEVPLGRGVASMRPRPDAAENLQRARDVADEWLDASMRPRPDAAENERSGRPALRVYDGLQ